MCLITKWFGNWMVTWTADKKSSNWMIIRYLWTNNSHLWTIRTFSYRTFCPLFRSPFDYQTKSPVTSGNWMFPVMEGPTVVRCIWKELLPVLKHLAVAPHFRPELSPGIIIPPSGPISKANIPLRPNLKSLTAESLVSYTTDKSRKCVTWFTCRFIIML